ncbi:iron-containing redox enzyme family protein, partial [Rhodococcus erythropolis]|nr:iron-containing redox enzyme family protein [Rhodococcus erythropolis]
MSSSLLDSATGVPTSMPVPQARGPLSATLVSILRSSADPRELTAAADAYEVARSIDPTYDILRDDDAQLTLTLLYELHLQGIENVSDAWEWNLDLLAARSRLETNFEAAIVELVGKVPSSGDVVADLW